MPGVPGVLGQDVAGLAGRAMLLAGAALLVLSALVLVVPRLVRVRRRALALRTTVAAAERDALASLALLRARRAETDALLAPWRRLRRWMRHPLVVAALEWYGRRRERAAEAARAHG